MDIQPGSNGGEPKLALPNKSKRNPMTATVLAGKDTPILTRSGRGIAVSAQDEPATNRKKSVQLKLLGNSRLPGFKESSTETADSNWLKL